MSITYPNLTGTNFPDALDIAAPFTSALREATSWEENTDGEDYVLSTDINILQDAILAIQGIIGAKDITVINEDAANLMERIADIISGASSGSDALVNHRHTGEAGSPALIDLSSHVTGSLPAARILTSGTGSLNATTINTGSTGGGLSVEVALGNKLDRSTGGTVTGNVTVTGQIISSLPLGSPPLAVTSSTMVTNLNADLLDGKQGAEYATIVGTETLTNKTLTSPKINEAVNMTATSTQLNHMVGVTSSVQTQLNNKADLVGGKVPANQATNPGGSIVSATAPANTSVLWVDTTAGGVLKYHNGTAWTTVKYAYV